MLCTNIVLNVKTKTKFLYTTCSKLVFFGETMALTRTRNQATRTRFELHEPISPNQQSPPRLVPPNFMAGPMASAHISRIFAVVPRASPLSQLQSHTLPSNSNDPPPPPRGGAGTCERYPSSPPSGGAGRGDAFVRCACFSTRHWGVCANLTSAADRSGLIAPPPFG